MRLRNWVFFVCILTLFVVHVGALSSQTCFRGAWGVCLDRPIIGIFAIGGTIFANGTHRASTTNYTDYISINPSSWVKGIPEASELAEFRFKIYPSKGSPDLTTEDNLAISYDIYRHRYEFHAVIVLMGTDTAPTTINQHSDVFRTPLPVGYVAAARPDSALSADGRMNFVQAVQVLCDPSSREYGAFLMFNDKIWGPQLLYKQTTNGLEIFNSPAGPLGVVKDEKPHFWYGPREHRGRQNFDVKKLAKIEPPRVDMHFGTEYESIAISLRNPEVAGVVIIGQGAGSIPMAGRHIIGNASAENTHKPIVVCLMIPDGFVGYPMYGTGDWAIPGGYWDGPHCRYAIQLALMSGMDARQIRHLFEVDAVSLKPDPFFTLRLYWLTFEQVVMMTIQDSSNRLQRVIERLHLLVGETGRRIYEKLFLFLAKELALSIEKRLAWSVDNIHRRRVINCLA